MAYYLGRDVSVTLAAGDDVGVTSSNLVYTGSATTDFCNKLVAGLAVSDLTGVDLGIGVTDEDVSYIGLRSVLKAEIKKETTVSLTRKKSNNTWDVIFNGPTASASAIDTTVLTQGARWGLDLDKISHGRASPLDHKDAGGSQTYGYRVYVQLRDAVECIAVPNCVITGHTVTLNGDGTTEETMEFSSQVNPVIGANATDCEGTTTAANL